MEENNGNSILPTAQQVVSALPGANPKWTYKYTGGTYSGPPQASIMPYNPDWNSYYYNKLSPQIDDAGDYYIGRQGVIDFLKAHPEVIGQQYAKLYNSGLKGYAYDMTYFELPPSERPYISYSDDEVNKILKREQDELIGSYDPLIDETLSPRMISELLNDKAFFNYFTSDENNYLQNVTNSLILQKLLKRSMEGDSDTRWFSDYRSTTPYFLRYQNDPERREQVSDPSKPNYVDEDEVRRRQQAYELFSEGQSPFLLRKNDDDSYEIYQLTGDLQDPYIPREGVTFEGYKYPWEHTYQLNQTPIYDDNYYHSSPSLTGWQNFINGIKFDFINPDLQWYKKGWWSAYNQIRDRYSPNNQLPTARENDYANNNTNNLMSAAQMAAMMSALYGINGIMTKIPALRPISPYYFGLLNLGFGAQGAYDLASNWDNLSNTERVWDAWMATGLAGPAKGAIYRLFPKAATFSDAMKVNWLYKPIMQSERLQSTMPEFTRMIENKAAQTLYNAPAKQRIYSDLGFRFDNMAQQGYLVPKSKWGQMLVNPILQGSHTFFTPTAVSTEKAAFDYLNNKGFFDKDYTIPHYELPEYRPPINVGVSNSTAASFVTK